MLERRGLVLRAPGTSPTSAFTAVVQAAGEIDLNCSLEFQQALLNLLDQHPQRIVINLSDVSYMDSSGVASLVKLLSRVRRGGASLHLVGLRDRVRGHATR